MNFWQKIQDNFLPIFVLDLQISCILWSTEKSNKHSKYKNMEF